MKLRKRVVGDLYLSASILFIFLAFLYFGLQRNGWPALVIGLVIGVFGARTKSVMIQREMEEAKPKRSKPRKRKVTRKRRK